MNRIRLVDQEFLRELQHVKDDLRAFNECRDVIQRRMSELEHYPSRREFFENWAGVQALVNVLIMLQVRCEGLIEDYSCILQDHSSSEDIN